ncbi:MAG: hypothetical protein ACU0CO_11115 [Shimia sp.]
MADDTTTDAVELDRSGAHPLRVISGWSNMAKDTTRLSRGWRDILTMDQFQELGDTVMRRLNEALDQVPRELRPRDSAMMTRHVEMMTRFGMLWQGGCRILSISPDLQEAIRRSELNVVRLGDVRLPHERFYVAFPGGLGLRMEDTNAEGRVTTSDIDGAYVFGHKAEDGRISLEVVVTGKRVDDDPHDLPWPLRKENHYTFHIKGQAEDTFEDAVGFAIKSGLLDTEVDQGQVDQFRESIVTTMPDAAAAGMKIHVPEVTGFERDAMFNDRNLNDAREALAAVLGVVFALTAKPELEDETPRWPSGSPENLVRDRANSKSPKAVRNVEIALLKSGFLPIHRVSLDTLKADDEQLRGQGRPDGRTVRPHWRAGHFRRQPYGPGRTKTRLIWVLPSFVTGNAGGEARPGRIEEISRG